MPEDGSSMLAKSNDGAVSKPLPSKNATILFVDDEPAVLKFLVTSQILQLYSS